MDPLAVTQVDLELFDKDISALFDDLLGSITRDLYITLAPGGSDGLSFLLQVPTSILNNANDFLEGSALELAADGRVTFSDLYGTRTETFGVAVPEPGTLYIMGLMLIVCFLCHRGIRWKPARPE